MARARSAQKGAARSLAALIAVCLVISALVGANTAPQAQAVTEPIALGAAASFVVFGGTIANTGPTQLTGDAGTSPGTASIAFPPGKLSGAVHLGDSVAAAALTDLTSAYTAAKNLTATGAVSGDLAGLTLTPGVYASAAALSLSATLTLDGNADATSIFVIQVDAAFALAASARVLLTNGAQADHVFWQVGGAVTIGASATFVGTVLGYAAITVGANATVVGRVLSTSGAVSLSTNSILPQAPVSLGSAFAYSALAATAIANSGASTFSANVGVSPGSQITGFPPGQASGTLHPGDAEANQAQVDLHTAYIDAADRTTTATLPTKLNGAVLSPGIWHSPGAVSLTSVVTLDGQNNPDSLFIITVAGNLAVGASGKIRLINGADTNRIFWQISGTTTLGPASLFVGTILSQGSITVGANTQITGRMLTLTGSVTMSEMSSETLMAVDLATSAGYSALAGTSIENTGATVLNFNVGVSPGTTIHGFPPGTTSGTFHAGDAEAAQAHTDANAAYTNAASRTPTREISGDLAGITVLPGVYHSAAALSLSGTIHLDAQGDANSVFIFQVGAAFSTAANSSVVLANGAQLSKVFWQVEGAATLGAGSAFTGTIISLGAVTAGQGMTLTGRLISLAGAVTMGGSTVSSPTPQPGPLTATATATSLSEVTIDGVGTQTAQGTADGWSVSDDRGTGAAWTLTVSATDLVSDAGTVETKPRVLPAAGLSVIAGQATAASGSDPTTGMASHSLTLSNTAQTLMSSAGNNRGTYFLSPQFSLLVPATAYRSNYSGDVGASALNPYTATITISIY